MMRPVAASGHRPHRRVREPQHGAHVQVELALLVVERAGAEHLVHPESGVVDQDVDRVLRVGDPLGDRGAAVVGGQVGRQHLDRDAELVG